MLSDAQLSCHSCNFPSLPSVFIFVSSVLLRSPKQVLPPAVPPRSWYPRAKIRRRRSHSASVPIMANILFNSILFSRCFFSSLFVASAELNCHIDVPLRDSKRAARNAGRGGDECEIIKERKSISMCGIHPSPSQYNILRQTKRIFWSGRHLRTRYLRRRQLGPSGEGQTFFFARKWFVSYELIQCNNSSCFIIIFFNSFSSDSFNSNFRIGGVNSIKSRIFIQNNENSRQCCT